MAEHSRRSVSANGLAWRKSSRSGDGNGSCVETAAMDGTQFVRDSKNRPGPVLAFLPGGWRAFLAGLVDEHSGDG
jgi:hypothetical protein